MYFYLVKATVNTQCFLISHSVQMSILFSRFQSVVFQSTHNATFPSFSSVGFSEESYLNNQNKWFVCTAPEKVVEFNIGLFSTLVAVSAVQTILCSIQMINGLFGCLCGTCKSKGVRSLNVFNP